MQLTRTGVAAVPAGRHVAAIVPAAKTGAPQLPAEQATLVYVVGSPRDGSTNVVSHRVRIVPVGPP